MSNSLDYRQLQEICVKYLNERKFISVATSYRDQVRARVVDYVNDGLRIAFLTWKDTVKMEHLKHNPRIALCVDSLQVEGKASMMGHPSLPENNKFMDIYQKRHPSPFRNFIDQPEILQITVEPELMILMKYERRHLYLDHLDILKQEARRDVLSPWDPT